MLNVMNELQEQKFWTNKASLDLDGVDSDKEANTMFRSLITMIKSENVKKWTKKSQKKSND